MKQLIRYVAIAARTKQAGDGECEKCGHAIWKSRPTNYPQVCHECADKIVWHYCDRPRQKPEKVNA